jgi:hypothetical protein
MKYVAAVTSFVKNHTLYSFSCFLTIGAVFFIDVGIDKNHMSVTEYIAIFIYLVGFILMICPLHYKTYRILYNIYSRFPKWLQPHPPSIPRSLRRTYQISIPNKWSTVDMLGDINSLISRHESASDWCEANSIGRYHIGLTRNAKDTPFSFQIHFEDGKDAFMCRIAIT